MTTGMLWFYDDKKPLEEEIDRAVKYFAEKYLCLPDMIEVPIDSLKKKYQHGKIEIVPDKVIVKSTMWITNKDMSNKIENGELNE